MTDILCPECGSLCLPVKSNPGYYRKECGCKWYSRMYKCNLDQDYESLDSFDLSSWNDINGNV